LQMADPNSCQLDGAGSCPASCTVVNGACMVPSGAATNPRYNQPTWFCGRGTLADGVTGYAVRGSAPRPFYLGSLTWGANTWNRHYELQAALGSISERIPTGLATGYALDRAWGLNPNDTHADGRSKIKDYIAALGTKTSTSRNGVLVSPYNRADR